MRSFDGALNRIERANGRLRPDARCLTLLTLSNVSSGRLSNPRYRRSPVRVHAGCLRSPLLRKDAKIELLKNVPHFSHCNKKQLAAIAGLADLVTCLQAPS